MYADLYINSILFLNKSTILLQCEQGSVANVDTTDAMQREWYHHGTMAWVHLNSEFCERNLLNCKIAAIINFQNPVEVKK